MGRLLQIAPGADMKQSCKIHALAAMAACCALGASAFVVPFSQQQGGRTLSPSTQSRTSVLKRAGHRRARSYQALVMSETAGEKEGSAIGGASQTDMSAQRTQEVLTVLSTVNDPGESADSSTRYLIRDGLS